MRYIQQSRLDTEALVKEYLNRINKYVALYIHDKLTNDEYHRRVATIYYDVINTCKNEDVLAGFIEDDWVQISIKGAI